ncbi:hypothetical protein DICPUDRAFT_157232 [Dictyostelium purpureum]|uniref:Uncharacterized protein n=1 Tax=Dictyostelium purpureum TaxID=5786 RepID=F0ZYL8_DICPU|nr:uncharacterized protein DICPUDRAFT_157232 [Dictyostelium purpureum]EGC30958.1 hypothetical protein DICPUDRAFT_157232 [Dictyostelium purpureum]|eukprot:XP_003292509.1 hypothetical protein DICPUDRAFT_157232 [Dictyostelium purpureum]
MKNKQLLKIKEYKKSNKYWLEKSELNDDLEIESDNLLDAPDEVGMPKPPKPTNSLSTSPSPSPSPSIDNGFNQDIKKRRT